MSSRETTEFARSKMRLNWVSAKRGAPKIRFVSEKSFLISLIKNILWFFFSLLSAMLFCLGIAKLWAAGFVFAIIICAIFVLCSTAEFFAPNPRSAAKHSYLLYHVGPEEWVNALLEAGLMSQSQQKSHLYSMHNVYGGLSVSVQWSPSGHYTTQFIKISFFDEVDADICYRLIASVVDIIEKRR